MMSKKTALQIYRSSVKARRGAYTRYNDYKGSDGNKQRELWIDLNLAADSQAAMHETAYRAGVTLQEIKAIEDEVWGTETKQKRSER